MNKRIRNLFCLLMGLLGFKSLPAQAVDIFLCSGSFEGESQDPAHKGCVDVLAWSWGMSNAGLPGTPGKANATDLSVTKYIDKSSPDLLLYTSNGTSIPTLKLDMRGTCPDACTEPFYTLTLGNVLVTSYSTATSAGEDRPTESVSFNFTKVEWCYTPVVNGKPGITQCENWSVPAP